MGMRKTFILSGLGAASFGFPMLIESTTQTGGIFVGIGFLFFIAALVSWLFEDKPAKQEISGELEANYQDLRQLSNVQLRDKAIDLASQMRSFQANFDLDAQSIIRGGEHEEYAQKAASFSAEFRTRFRPDAVTIRKELSERMGVFPPYKKIIIALDYDLTTGALSIPEAADHLDELARSLP